MKKTISVNGQEFEVSATKNKSNREYFDLVIKNPVTKKSMRIFRAFWYTEGWSQGMGRSVRGYYLNVEHYGSMGNGSGQSSKGIPYLSYDILEFITECMSGKHYNAECNEFYKLSEKVK